MMERIRELLEGGDRKVIFAAAAFLALVLLFMPVSPRIEAAGQVRPRERDLTVVSVPTAGYVRYVNFHPGARVRKGEVLFRYALRRFPTDELPEDQAASGIWQSFSADERKLREGQQRELMDAAKDSAFYAEQLKQVKADLAKDNSGRNKARVEAAQRDYDVAKNHEVEIGAKYRGQFKELELQRDGRLDRLPAGQTNPSPDADERYVLAEDDGVVWSISIRSGERLREGQACFELIQEPDAVEVRVPLPPKVLAQLGPATQAELRFSGWPLAPFRGRFARLVPADPVASGASSQPCAAFDIQGPLFKALGPQTPCKVTVILPRKAWLLQLFG